MTMTPEERATEIVDLYCYMRGTGTATDERLRQDIERAIHAAENDALERAAKAAEAQACTFGSMAEEIHSQATAKDCARAIRALKHGGHEKWQPIETAPKDGSTIQVKRIYEGDVIYEGPAAWRTVHFGACRDPISGAELAPPCDATGWMYPAEIADKRVPEPTHWLPSD